MDEILNYKRDKDDNYYIILGCSESASAEQICAEYKARVLTCHPDKHPNDPTAHEKFAKLSEAKEVLLDPVKRNDYDKWRNSSVAMSYERWKSMPHIKTSMHWGFKSEQPAIDQSDRGPSASTQQAAVKLKGSPSPLLVETQNKMKFVHREKHQAPGWERNNSNSLLQKFRNYEI